MPANTAEVLRQVEASGVVPGGWVGEAMLGLAQLHHHWKSSRDFSALTVKRFIVKNNQDFSPTKALRAVLDARHGDRPAGHWVTNDHNIQRSPIGRCGIRMESERSILFHQYLRKDREIYLQLFISQTREAPAYVDRSWEVRQMLEAWNQNTEEQFVPSWISCLDESMLERVNEYTCPGFMCAPRKPWPFGNEYYTIADGECRVIYVVEPPKEFIYLAKTVGLLLRLTKMIWHTSNLVVLDSGLCVLKGLIELRKKGVFAYALIKKRRCWPKFICGDEITNHFQDKEVGAVDAWPGTLDRNPFHVADDNIWENEAGWRSAWEEGGQKRRKTFDIQR